MNEIVTETFFLTFLGMMEFSLFGISYVSSSIPFIFMACKY